MCSSSANACHLEKSFKTQDQKAKLQEQECWWSCTRTFCWKICPHLFASREEMWYLWIYNKGNPLTLEETPLTWKSDGKGAEVGSKQKWCCCRNAGVQSAAAAGPEETRLDGGDVLLWKKTRLSWLLGEAKSWLRFIWLKTVPIGTIS